MPDVPEGALDETRVALVDPSTGTELRPNDETPDGTPEVDCDRTRIARGKVHTANGAGKTTAQFLPESGLRATGEITSAWVPDRPVAAALGRRLERLRPLFGKRGRVALLASTALAGAIAVAMVPGARGEPDLNRKPADPTQEEASPPEPPAGEDLVAVRPPQEEGGPVEADLSAAVDAVLAGHLEEALRGYEALRASDPQNESFALAARILSRQLGGER